MPSSMRITSVTSASNCCSRVEGPAFPAAKPDLPASRNWRFQFPTHCSDTFARRAASATVISPARIDSTIRTFSSAGNTGGLAMTIRLLDGQARKKRALPGILTRDRTTLLHTERGDHIAATGWLGEAATRCSRVTDRYQWVHGY